MRSTNATIKLAGSASAFSDTIHLLPLNPSMPTGVLPPGTTGQITLSSTALVGTANYELSYVPADSTEQFPWNAVESAWRPADVSDAEWIPFWANVTSSIGATWAEVLGRIADIATQGNVSEFEKYSFDSALNWLITLESSPPNDAHSHCPYWTLDRDKCAALYDPSTDVRLRGTEPGTWNPNASRTFILTHGNGGPVRKSGERSGQGVFDQVAAKIRAIPNYPDANIVLIEWPNGSGHRNPRESAPQIDRVAEYAVTQLQELQGFDGSKVTMIGESFGNYVNNGIAARLFGGVDRIIAMDPANEWGDYTPPNLRLNSHVAYSFITCGPFDTKRDIADKTFVLETPFPFWDPGRKHTFGIDQWLPMQLMSGDARVLDGDLSGEPEGSCSDSDSPRFNVPPGQSTRVVSVGSFDPNEKDGLAGFGTAGFVPTDTTLPYTVFFENSPQFATAPAQEVTITDTLDSDLDWNTFSLGGIGFGEAELFAPQGSRTLSASVDSTNSDGSPLRVKIEASVDLATGVVQWAFRSIDPSTGQLPEDPFAGFLPVNDETHRGEGFVTYFVRPRTTISSGTRIDNSASIVFDTNNPIVTNTVFNMIDSGPPTSSVAPLPPFTTSTTFTVTWSGSDDPGGSGIAFFDVFVSDNGQPVRLWLDNTTDGSADFEGEFEHTYGFFSVATDNVGNAEAIATAPQAITRTRAPDTTPPSVPPVPDLDPASDSGSSNSDNITNDNTPTISGAAEANSAVDVFDGDNWLGNTSADAVGRWSFASSAMNDGIHGFRARATDAAGNGSDFSETLYVTIDTTAPTVRGIETIRGTRNRISRIKATFSEPLDDSKNPADLSNYLLRVGRKTIRLASAGYDLASGTVLVSLQKPIAQNRTPRATFTVNGSGSIFDWAGNQFDGDRNGEPGGDLVWHFPAGSVTSASSMLAPAVVDAVLASTQPGVPSPMSDLADLLRRSHKVAWPFKTRGLRFQ